MKQTMVYLCILAFTAINLSAQKDFSVSVDSGYINVDGGKLYYEIAGEGDYIVLLHDGILHNVVWDKQFPVLAKKYRVVRYDRRGFGKSSAPEAPFSHIDDLNEVFTQLKIDNAIVFGMSAGGGLTINFTINYPEKVKAMVLTGAVVGGYGYSSHMLTRGGHITSLVDYLEPEKFIQYFGWDDPYEIYPENMKAKEKFFKWLKENPQNVRGALGYFSKPPEINAVNHLSEIKAPALVLVGEYDIPDVHAHSGVIQSGIANAKREIILNAGHLVPLEQPEKFNELAMSFLDRVEFFNILNSKGVTATVNYFNKMRELKPEIILFDEAEMNILGYTRLQNGQIKEAIELFKLNSFAYPESGNVYDSLGEAYLKDDQTDLAISNYEKSLELNPKNTNAIDVLNDIKTGNLLKHPESIIYDAKHNRYLLSNYDTGNIIQIDGAGKQSIWVENMNAIQGLEIVGNVVYVGARNSVRGFDLETGEMVMNVPVEGVSNLNDVTADEEGNIYAGDVFGTKIIKVNTKDNSYSVFIDGNGIDHPNGMFFDKANKRILVCSFRKNFPIQAINLMDKTVITLVTTNMNNADGIVLDKNGRCYVTSWDTKSIYRFDKDFAYPPTVFYTNTYAPADISYDSVHEAIAVPLMLHNSWEIVPIN